MPRALDGAKITIAPAMYDAIADGMKGNANAILAALTTQSTTAKLRIVRYGYGYKEEHKRNSILSCANASTDNNFLDLIFNFSALANDFGIDTGAIEYSPDGTKWTKLFDIKSRMDSIDTTSSYWFEIKITFLEGGRL